MQKTTYQLIFENAFLYFSVFVYISIKILLIFFLPNIDLTVDDTSTYISFANSLKNKTLISVLTNNEDINFFFRTPLYPFIIYIFDGNIKLISLLQSLLWGLLCLILFKNYNKNRNLVYYFLIIYFLFHPNIFYHTLVLLPETFFIFTVGLSLFFLIKGSSFSIKKVLLFYFLICLSTLIKPVSYYLVYIFFVFFIFYFKNSKTLKYFLLFSLIAFLSTTGLWCLRNYYLFNSFSLSYVDKYNIIYYIADRLYNGEFGEGSSYLISKYSHISSYLERLELMYNDSISLILDNKIDLIKNHIFGSFKMLFSPGDTLIYHLFESHRFPIYKIIENKKITFQLIFFSASFISILILYFNFLLTFFDNFIKKNNRYLMIIFILLILYFIAVSSHYDSYSRFRLPIEVLGVSFILKFKYE